MELGFWGVVEIFESLGRVGGLETGNFLEGPVGLKSSIQDTIARFRCCNGSGIWLGECEILEYDLAAENRYGFLFY